MCTACCRWPQSIAQGPRTQLSRPRDVMHASWAGDFFFFFFFGSADPRIFEDSNGSSADPDRSGFRWIRFTPKKKVSASTNMAQIFTGGRSVFFYLLKFFYTQIRYANLYFSRAGSSNSGSGSLTARRTSLPEYIGRTCVLDGWPRT